MESEYKIRRRVEFAETDMAGIMHFSHFFRYMEVAETEFFRSLGLTLIDRTGNQTYGWPRVRAKCDYHHPLRFGEEVEIHLYVKEIKVRAIIFFFRFRRCVEGGESIAIAKGEITTVCATLNEDTMEIVSMAIPEDVLAKIEQSSRENWKDQSTDS
jgi:YbgC/YbaW family acyl-CoA thioester hydrolase